jgi:inosine-uridine nucleoside N-ribohydrolase
MKTCYREIGLILLFGIGPTALTAAGGPVDVWLDVDPANNVGEIDDGLAMIQAFHSPELRVRGVSVVFGNAPLRYAAAAAFNVVGAFGPEGMAIHRGAASEEEFGEDNEAVQAMATALRERPLTILALGPVTNVGTLVRLHPELGERIEAIVVVAGRRPGQRFINTELARDTFPRDFNFESDVQAMRAILDTDIPLVLAPWEVSSHVWVTGRELAALGRAGPPGAYIHATSQHWLASWRERRGVDAFNPYDTLAVGWLTHPRLIEAMPVTVRIQEETDERDPLKTKSYLVVRPEDESAGRGATYLYRAKPGFKRVLLERLVGPPKKSEARSATFDHGLLDEVLRKYVDSNGLVDYAGLRKTPDPLDRYLDSVAEADLSALSRDEELALLINVYNAATLRLILDHYPVGSIREIPADRRWKDARWIVGGHRWSLDEIEHEQIRPRFEEPRIHFALVCAALDCPPLRSEAFTADKLEDQLEDQTLRVHNDPRWLRFDRQRGVVELTPLYQWYDEDFLLHGPSVLEHASRYHAPLRRVIERGELPRIEWREYDWSLNVREP